MLLSEIQNSLKSALPYQTIRCSKYYLGREVLEFSSQYYRRQVLKIGKFQPSVAFKSVAYKKNVYVDLQHNKHRKLGWIKMHTHITYVPINSIGLMQKFPLFPPDRTACTKHETWKQKRGLNSTEYGGRVCSEYSQMWITFCVF